MGLIARRKSSWENHHLSILQKFCKLLGRFHKQFWCLIIEDEFDRFHSRLTHSMCSIEFRIGSWKNRYHYLGLYSFHNIKIVRQSSFRDRFDILFLIDTIIKNIAVSI